MGQTLLTNIQKGVKSALVKQRIITHLIYAGSTTITFVQVDGTKCSYRDKICR